MATKDQDDRSYADQSLPMKRVKYPLGVRVEFRLLALLAPGRLRKEMILEIKEFYLEILESEGTVEANKRTHWELRVRIFDFLKHHLEITLVVEGVLRLFRLIF